MRNTHTIDASGKSLGRLAVEIANLLRGKHKPDFAPNKDGSDFVEVKNINQMKITGKKLKLKIKPRRPGDAHELVADPAKIKKELGFSPRYSDLKTIIKSAWVWHQTRL